MATKINLNGVIEDHAWISVLDHGFLFGDSVYEVISTHRNRPCFMKEHLQRLRNSAQALSLKIPYDDDTFIEEINKTLQAAGNRESYIRIIVTRGVGDMDIDPVTCEQPNIVIFVTHVQEYPREYFENGINIALVTVKRNPRDSLNPGIKTGNYLNNVLAKLEANKLGAQDALMLNPWGYLTECTTSNIFFVKEGRVLTPSLECGILAGITRDLVLRLARENGLPTEEGQWPAETLENADEIFLTGTVKRIMPVTRLDGKAVGKGIPGPVTRNLMRLYNSLLEGLE